LDALTPRPATDGYNFFENAAGHPFEKTLEFRQGNAWWLMDVAYLAYATSGPIVVDALRPAGLQGEVFGFDRADPPHVVVAHNDNIIVIAFRGTSLQSFPDVLADALFFPAVSGNGLVHSGFQSALVSGGVWNEVQGHVRNIPGNQIVFFTGHSLGAALATIARRGYRDPIGRPCALYTFGSPRVGDELMFCANYPSNSYRIVNDQDLVAHVPTPPVYGHVGTPFGIDGKPFAVNLWDAMEHNFSDVARALAVFSLGSRQQRLRDYFASQAAKPLGDHAPRSYATKIWNGLIAR
jgi:hypothetical protein